MKNKTKESLCIALGTADCSGIDQRLPELLTLPAAMTSSTYLGIGVWNKDSADSLESCLNSIGAKRCDSEVLIPVSFLVQKIGALGSTLVVTVTPKDSSP